MNFAKYINNLKKYKFPDDTSILSHLNIEIFNKRIQYHLENDEYIFSIIQDIKNFFDNLDFDEPINKYLEIEEKYYEDIEDDDFKELFFGYGSLKEW